jgi:hypothetical protein
MFMRRAGRTLIVTLLCGSLAALTASPMALAQSRGNSGLPAGSGNPIATLEQQMTRLQQQVNALSALGADVNALKAQMGSLSTLQSQIDGLRTQASQQADSLAAMGKDISALREQLATLSALQRQVNFLTSQVQNMSSLQKQVDALSSQVATLSAAVANGGASDKLAVYDSTDQKVGDVVGVQDNVPWVSINVDNRSFVLQVLPQQLVGQFLWFGAGGCVGPNVYISGMTLSKGANVFALAAVYPDGTVYAAEPNTAPVLLPVSSVMDANGVCTSFRTFNQNVVPASPVTSLYSVFHRPYSVR